MKVVRKLLVILLLITTCACSSAKQYAAYTVYPIGYLLNRIGGNAIKSVSIQSNSLVQISNVNEDFIETLNDSYVLFRIGELEPYLDLYDDELKQTEVPVVDLSVLNALYYYKRYKPIIVDGKLNFIEGEYYDDPIFEEIDTYNLDPFIWLSPIGMLSMAKNVYTYLSNNYVEQSAYFLENYNKLVDELIALDAAYQELASELVSSNKVVKFVSLTGSFGCWQKDFGIQVYPVCLSKYGAIPTETQLEIIKQKIIQDNVKYIAYEPNLSEEMTKLFGELEDELSLKRVTLYNISSLSEESSLAGKDYMTLMYENLNILKNIATVETTAENNIEE